MATLAALTQALTTALARAPLDNGSIRFDLGDAGVIRAEGSQADNSDRPADCTLRADKADFDEMLAGRLDPRTAMMSGIFTVEGELMVLVGALDQIRGAWGPLYA